MLSTTKYAINLFLVLGVLASSGCERRNTYVPPPPPQVSVSLPSKQKIRDYLEFTGNTQALNSVELVARVQGILEKVFFHDGDVVKKGQLLFLIQQNTYEARLKQAEAQLEQNKARLQHAQNELKRFTDLVRQHAAAQTDLANWRFERDNAKAAVMAALAARELARLDLGYTEVKAPFDGRIGRRLKDPGNLVGAGENTPLAQINQIDPIYVYFTINEAELLKIIQQTKIGPDQAQRMNIPAYLGLSPDARYPYEGHLDFTAIAVTPTTGTLLLRAIFPNCEGKIIPGLFARIKLLVANSERTALLVPESAVSYDQIGSFLLAVNENNIVERRTVKLGQKEGDKRVITEGINEGDWIIVKGLLRAIPGSKAVPVRNAPGESGLEQASPQAEPEAKK